MSNLLIATALIFAASCLVEFPGNAFVRFLWRLGSTLFWVVLIEGLTILI